MIIKVREKEYEAPPFPYKRWVELEEKGIEVEQILQEKKACPVCEGTKKVNNKKCTSCEGDGQVIDISKKNIYALLESVLLHIKVGQEIIDSLTINEVVELMPIIINFMVAKESPEKETT
jgi:RecJ-like exonuclease